MKLTDILNNIHHLPETSLSRLTELAEPLSVGKNEIIISADTVCHDVYFIAEGIVRAFSYAKGREITFWIGTEGSVALSMQSYINGSPGYENIVTLEPCRLFRISVSALKALYHTDIEIANWGRKFAEKEILRAEKTLIPQLFTTGKERYETLLREHPQLLNRIPLEKLASYLGLTPVSLSRIRGSLSRK